MIFPPSPIDPKKDFWKEMVRYTVEHHHYTEAVKNGVNDHGPWQKPERKQIRLLPKPDHITYEREGDKCEHYYWDRQHD